MKMILVSSVKDDSVGFVAQVHVQHECGGVLVVLLGVLLVISSSAGVFDALLVGHAGFAHGLVVVGLLFASGQELIFLLLFLAPFVHSVKGLINMFGIRSRTTDLIFFKVWRKGALSIINLSTNP